MPLLQCPDCGKDVSTMAPACPHCGRPMTLAPEPVDQTIEAVAAGKRIACPDGNCTGAIGENGECRTCGKNTSWVEPSDNYQTTLAYKAGKVYAKNKAATIFVMALMALMLAFWPKAPEKRPSAPEAAQAAPRELTKEEKIKRQFSGWNGAHIGLERLVKRHMNDPDSYDHIETRYTEEADGIALVMKYRGANSFGGKVINHVIAKADFDGKIVSILYQGE